MRFNSIIYPEGLAIIKSLGIDDRIKGLNINRGFLSETGIVEIIKDLYKEGIYKSAPNDLLKRLNDMIQRPEDFSWMIMRDKKTLEPCEVEDVMFFSGEYSSMLLPKEEIWELHGCSSSSAFVSLLHAYVQDKERPKSEGYTWISERNNQRILNEVTGTHDGDLLVFQSDITPYETFDPFGSKILFRPETYLDHIGSIAPGHSTESTLLVVVLKYMHQMNISVNYEELFKFSQSVKNRGGFWADGSNGLTLELLFCSFREFPIMDVTDGRTVFGVCKYGAFISEEDLVFLVRGEEKARFKPEDAFELVKGLIYQSAKGLGRTPLSDILDCLDYYCSGTWKDHE